MVQFPTKSATPHIPLSGAGDFKKKYVSPIFNKYKQITVVILSDSHTVLHNFALFPIVSNLIPRSGRVFS